MNAIDKEKIQRLCAEGLGYKAIASRLSLSVDTVKSFCKCIGLDGAVVPNKDGVCQQCGKTLERKTGSDRTKFCSDQCRSTWWGGHTNLYKQKAENRQICAHCGREFYSFHSKRCKYVGTRAMCLRALGRCISMTPEQFDWEKKYQAALSIAHTMLKKGIIDEDDYAKTEKILRVKFCPFIGAFQTENP